MEAAYRIQANYNERVRLGLDSGNEPEPVGMNAVQWMMKAYSSYEYKLTLDRALVANDYQALVHDVFLIDHEAPVIAVCSHFGLDYVSDGGDWARVSLNVLPLGKTQSAAIFSYLEQDAPLIRAELNDVLNASGSQQKYLLSKRILNHCGNFVVSPAHFDSWSAEKQAAITAYFCQTLLESHLEIENELLYLF